MTCFSDRPVASVVMAAHAKPERLRLALAGIAGQRGVAFELIVVADGATAQALKVLDVYRNVLGVKVIETDGKGRAAARNRGANAAKGETIIFVDDDMLTENDFVFRHVDAQRKSPGLIKGRLREILGLVAVTDPAEGGVGCKPIRADELSSGNWSRDGVRVMANALEQAVEQPVGRSVPWLASAGANLSIPRAIWTKTERFDAGYGLDWGLEDIDFGYSVHRQGIEITLCPEALGLHMSHAQPGRWEQQNRNWRRFTQKVTCPDALALPYLLSADGSVAKFIEALAQIRQDGTIPDR